MTPFPRSDFGCECSRKRCRDVNKVGKSAIDCVAFRLGVDELRVIADHIVQGAAVSEAGVGVKLFAQVVCGEDDRAGMLFLDVAIEVRRVADLRLNLLFAIAEIIVGDKRDDHSRVGAAGEFECLAVVCSHQFRPLPTHTVRRLAVGRLADVRQAEARGFGHPREVRRTRITAPVWPVQCSMSSPASFSGRRRVAAGAARSTRAKSDLPNQAAGRKKRISIRFSGDHATAPPGQTSGRSKSDTPGHHDLPCRFEGGVRQCEHVAAAAFSRTRKAEQPGKGFLRRRLLCPPESATLLRKRGTCRWSCGDRSSLDCAARHGLNAVREDQLIAKRIAVHR